MLMTNKDLRFHGVQIMFTFIQGLLPKFKRTNNVEVVQAARLKVSLSFSALYTFNARVDYRR